MEPGILRHYLFRNCRGAVRRAVVDHEHFDPLQRLRSQTVQTRRQGGHSVGRNDHHGE